MNKFLDDSKIIKKEEQAEESFDLGFDEEEQKEEHPMQAKEEKKKINTKKKNVEKKEKVNILQPKTKLEILVEMVNKTNEQLISKYIDLDLNQFLYNDCGSNAERNRYQQTIKNIAHDIRIIEKKLQFLQKRYNDEKKG